jgi:squalene-associated FAD-dependent desaturase
MTTVLVVGGGFAGLSAAVALARRGCSVTLVEQRRILGGRAYSIEDGTTGDLIDNGQHALLGAFREARQFLRTLGTEDRVRYQERFKIVLVEPGGRRLELVASRLPAPFHLAAGLMRCPGFSGSERLLLLRAGLSIALTEHLPEAMTVEDWMNRLGQPGDLRRRFWYPIAIAALNEQPQRASADLLLKVLKLAFFGRAADSPFGIMTVGLGELYTEQARRLIEENKGEVLINAPAQRIHFSDRKVESVELRNGSRLMADYYISAVPHGALKRLLPSELLSQGAPFEGLRHLSDSPILSIHLWFDRPVMDEDFIGLVGSPIHWVFDKSRLWQRGEARTGAVACVVSGAYDLMDRSRSDLISMAQSELGRYLPEVKTAKLLHHRLIKERQATYSCTPTAERWRPAQETPYPNFFLAGDWTRTGLPATIESAVRSGHRCADLIQTKDLK